MPSMIGGSRPKLTRRALRRWVPALIRHAPSLVTAYIVPGRVPPTIREAAMLGVTSVNGCQACESVHGRWAKAVGLRLDDLSPGEVAAHDFGQRLATSRPHDAGPPVDMSERHQRELLAVSILMELANLTGNRFMPPRAVRPTIQIGDARTARLFDLGMRVADRAGLGRVRRRVAGRATGDVLEIGIGTGSNFRVYPQDVVVHGVDVSGPALSIAAERAVSAGRQVTLSVADAGALPFADDTFDTVVVTFVLCSVGYVDRSLREARRVLRPGGTIRLLEHARAGQPLIAALQVRIAPAWARVSGGCRLDHDVLGAVRGAELTLVETRQHAGGTLIEIVAA
jgi:AhpD family alkylhydroperoxidase